MKNIGDKLFIAGIDTEIGKTVVSAIFTQALHADYWKPIQCGGLDQSDSMVVQKLVSNLDLLCHPERHSLSLPKSPHTAARHEHIEITMDDFALPKTSGALVVEGVGGVLAPLNNKNYCIDLALRFSLPVVVVSKHYLGSLNHTFLTIESIKKRGLNIVGLVFNGPLDEKGEQFISDKTEIPVLLRVAQEPTISRKIIQKYAQILQRKIGYESTTKR